MASLRPTLVFAGSFQDYSSQVLNALLASATVKVVGVLTTPPQPQGRRPEPVPNPVHQLALEHELPVWTPAELDDDVLQTLTGELRTTPDLLLTAGYGKLLPPNWLSWPKFPALNLHFSLLPKYRGANPAEWAILRGETETGITLIEMSPSFDTGTMVAQAALPLDGDSTRESVYRQLYDLGGEILPTVLEWYVNGQPVSSFPNHSLQLWQPAAEQPPSPTPYATRLGREDGFINVEGLRALLGGRPATSSHFSLVIKNYLEKTATVPDATWFERFTRAVKGFPSTWTKVTTARGASRLKIISCHVENGSRLVLDQVQLAGQQPALWSQIKNAVLDLSQ